MRRLAAVLTLGALAFPFAACSGDDDPRDLTTRLAPGQVRAGVITKESELIGGVTAEGKLGDYKLYNSEIAVIVEQPGPSDGYGIYGGMIVDADVIRPPGVAGESRFGEALTVYNLRTPKGLRAEVVNDGRDGKAAIVRVHAEDAEFSLIASLLGESSAPKGLVITIDYVLEPDSNALKVVSKIRNPQSERIHVGDHYLGFLMGDGLLQFLVERGFDVPETPGGRSPYYAAAGDEVSYSFFSTDGEFTPVISFDGFLLGTKPKFFIDPGDEYDTELYVVVGSGDLMTHERAHRKIMLADELEPDEVTPVRGVVRDAEGKVVPRAFVHVRSADKKQYRLRLRTTVDGTFDAELEPGDYVFTATVPGHDASADVAVSLPTSAPVELSLPASGKLVVLAGEGPEGTALPVKLMAVRTPAVEPFPASFGMPKGARGYERIEFLEPGRQTLDLPPGEWKVVVARGPEYELVEQTVTVVAGEEAVLEAPMLRSVDSTGWLCGDFHIHTQYSPDSDDVADHKVRAFGAEGLEVAAITDHGYLADLGPVVERLGYGRFVRTIVGEEVSTIHIGHINRYPVVQDFTMANKGAIDWYKLTGPEIFAAMRDNPANPLVQVNHPRSGSYGGGFIKGYFSGVGLDSDDFSVKNERDWSVDFDAMEVANTGSPDYRDWFAFLDRGMKKLATGNSDSHVAIHDVVGYPRNCVHVGNDNLAEFDESAFMGAMRKGRVVVSGGYFVELGAGELRLGDTVQSSALVDGKLPMQVRVQAPSWLGAATLEIVVNGQVVITREVPETLSREATRIAETLQVPVPENSDAWIIARVVNGPDLAPLHPGARSFGMTNPIYFDGNDNGKFDARIPFP